MSGVRIDRRRDRVLVVRSGRAVRLWRAAVRVSAHPAGGPQSALGVEQEHPGGDHALTGGKTSANLDAIGKLYSKRDGPRLEAVPGRDEDVLLAACVDYGITGNRDGLRPGQFEDGVAVEPGTQRAVWVGNGESDPQRARAFGQGRV
jgi:hypothetical protein